MSKLATLAICLILFFSAGAMAAEEYVGDERCPPPKDLQKYAPPYNPRDHPEEYPTFPGADLPGWSCSYQREDGVIVQYGDSRTPQQQWLAIFGDMGQQE